MSSKINIGDKFNRWTVLQYSHKNKYHNRYWLCRCDCGIEKPVLESALLSGASKSCSCLQKEVVKKRGASNKLPKFEQAIRSILHRYKYGASTRGYKWLLSEQHFRFLITQNCYYCNSEPLNIAKSKHDNGDFVYMGIDRRNNDEDYTDDNTVPCCAICNIAKQGLTEEQYINHCLKVVGNKSDKSN